MSSTFFAPCNSGGLEAARASAAGVGLAKPAGGAPSVTGAVGRLFGTSGGLDGAVAADGPSVTGAIPGAAPAPIGAAAGAEGLTTAGCASGGAAGVAAGVVDGKVGG